MKVLVVDDEPDVRHVFSFILQHIGCEVAEARNGTLALEALERESFDVILLDLRLPGVNGREVVYKLRHAELPLNKGIKIITTSANELRADDELHAFVDKVLCKPIEVKVLKEIMQAYIDSV